MDSFYWNVLKEPARSGANSTFRRIAQLFTGLGAISVDEVAGGRKTVPRYSPQVREV